MRSSLFAKIIALGIFGFSGNAMAAGTVTFNYLFNNNGSNLTLIKTFDTFTGVSYKKVPDKINPNSTATGMIYQTNTTIMGGSLTYQDSTQGNAGCIFTASAVYNSYTKKYSMSVSATPQGDAGAPAHTCKVTWDGNNSTGNFYIYPVITTP